MEVKPRNCASLSTVFERRTIAQVLAVAKSPRHLSPSGRKHADGP